MTIDNRPLMAVALGCALCASPALAQSTTEHTAYPPAANGEGRVTNAYATARWAEDWSAPGEVRKIDDPLDRLKHIRLDSDDDIYLTLAGEMRLRTNFTSNPGLVKGEHQRHDILRVTGGADLHLGEHVRLYGELSHADSSGHNIGTPSVYQENDLVVEQSFVEVTGTLGGLDLGARYGRQMFYDGSKMLVSQRDNNAIHYTQNGLRLWARGRDVRVDLFDFKPTAYGRQGTGDDRINDEIRFSGVTVGTQLPRDLLGGSKLSFDPFVWRLRRREAAWVGTVGREERVYVGAHAWGDVGPVNIDWTVNHQSGSFEDRAVDAWQVFTSQTVALGAQKGAPRIGFNFDYASGGGGNEDGPGAGKMRNAISPHGANTPFSHHLFLTASNLVELAPTLALSPVKSVKILADYSFAWRATTNDAIYRANTRPLAGTQLSTSHKTAEMPRLQVQWNISPRVGITARYEHVFAGPALREAGYGDSDFFGTWISLRF
ncbi:alginate export family protein [Novosphingobium sp. MBES04]|uniref:alginate export family protein n=1 Tax=Novosphingobium sp. MBES04 TaxID=1206458 RepID=UPI00057D591B|nr:alginate export family protein [Novosphingobium sp. MBES04]GAM06305.1 hypothetical conserved protein [Novosphingobium sp. MBES04]